jgi:hypothetical protein
MVNATQIKVDFNQQRKTIKLLFFLLSITKTKEVTSSSNGGYRTAQSGLSDTYLPAMSVSRSTRQQHRVPFSAAASA